jgi:hypothetical protein
MAIPCKGSLTQQRACHKDLAADDALTIPKPNTLRATE